MDEGELVAARYRLVAPIGRGAMGVVWLAQDERLDREVAVKQLLIDSSSDASPGPTTERAVREARIAAKLRHPNAIAVHDVVEHDGRACLVMEYLRSKSLDAVLVARAGLPPEEAAGIGAQIAAALAAAHAAGIVHRDVKPENILLTEDGTAKITDFGVSRAAGVGTVTATGILAGTPAYLAPEVAGGHDADQRSDVYSLGATLYTAIEGLPPFGVDDNPIALLHRVAAGAMAPPTRAGALTGLLGWLLRRDPADRPTMAVAREALAAASAGHAVPVPPPRTPTLMLPGPAASRPSRRAVGAGLAAVGLVAAGVVLGAVLGDDRPSTANTPPATSQPPTGQVPSTRGGARAGCTADYEVTNSWPNGYQVAVTVRNVGDDPVTGWTVRWRLPADQRIDSVWNGTLRRAGDEVTVANADWNATVPGGDSTSFGLNVTTSGAVERTPTVTCRGD